MSATKNTESLHEKTSDNKDKSTLFNLPEKVYTIRNSRLTDLYNEHSHIRIISNLFVASFLLLLANVIVWDYVNYGTFDPGWTVFTVAFNKFHWNIFIWFVIHCYTLFGYGVFSLWCRYTFVQLPKRGIAWYGCSVLLLILYYSSLFVLASKLIVYFEMGPACILSFTIYTVSLCFKLHAFIRTKTVKLLPCKSHSDDTSKCVHLPNFSKFYYFLWLPILIYRDSYPRVEAIRWRIVGQYAMNLLLTIAYQAVIIEWFVRRSIHDFGERIYTAIDICHILVQNTTAGFLIIVTVFYIIAHCPLNLLTELLRFGDRDFYGDWWTAVNYDEYYRKWSRHIQEWYYTYVYKDVVLVYDAMCTRRTNSIIGQEHRRFAKFLAKTAVLLLSAILHEWIMMYSFGCFYPVMSGEFVVFTVLFAYVSMDSNIVFWLSLSFGTSTLITFYGMEFYVRYKHNNGMINAAALPAYTPIMFDKQFFKLY